MMFTESRLLGLKLADNNAFDALDNAHTIKSGRTESLEGNDGMVTQSEVTSRLQGISNTTNSLIKQAMYNQGVIETADETVENTTETMQFISGVTRQLNDLAEQLKAPGLPEVQKRQTTAIILTKFLSSIRQNPATLAKKFTVENVIYSIGDIVARVEDVQKRLQDNSVPIDEIIDELQ